MRYLRFLNNWEYNIFDYSKFSQRVAQLIGYFLGKEKKWVK